MDKSLKTKLKLFSKRYINGNEMYKVLTAYPHIYYPFEYQQVDTFYPLSLKKFKHILNDTY
jgi:hypothetical protein